MENYGRFSDRHWPFLSSNVNQRVFNNDVKKLLSGIVSPRGISKVSTAQRIKQMAKLGHLQLAANTGAHGSSIYRKDQISTRFHIF